MRISIGTLMLLVQNAWAVASGYFYYDKDCYGNRALITWNKDNCIHLNDGYAYSMGWDAPGSEAIAVAYRKDSTHAFCGKEVCHINGLGDDACCNSSDKKKNIKGANLVSMKGRRGKRSVGHCLNAWEHGATFEVDVGQGVYVKVPNLNSTVPSPIEIREALAAAGVEENSDVLIARAITDL